MADLSEGGEVVRTLGAVLREARNQRGWVPIRLAMEVSMLDLQGVTADRIEAYEEDQVDPSEEEVAAIMATLGVTLAEVDGVLPWPAEALEAKLSWYVGRVVEVTGMGKGEGLGRRSRGEARGVEP